MIPGSLFEVLRHFREWKGESTDTVKIGGGSSEAQAAGYFGQYMILCTCFGITQGAILSTLTYTTTFMNSSVGSYCVGFFFGTFTLFSFCAADSIVTSLGCLLTYKTSFIFLMAYELLLWVSCNVHQNSPGDVDTAAMSIAYIGSILAGIGFSLLCTSQSVFYQQTSAAYAARRNLSVETINDTFGGVFTMIYVPLEMIMKQAASVLILLSSSSSQSDDGASDTSYSTSYASEQADDEVERRLGGVQVVGVKVWMEMFSMYVVLLLFSGLAAFKVSPLPVEEGEEPTSLDSFYRRVADRILETPRMFYYNKVLLYLMPINIGFGVVGGFLYTYFYGDTVSVYRGDPAVGFVSAIASAFCSISVLPLTAFTILLGKGPIIIFAAICYGMIGVLYLSVDFYVLGEWGSVIGIAALIGCGRAVWENTNRALYADLFSPTEVSSAFANMYMATGCTTFISLFLFPSLSLKTTCILLIIPACFMYPCYLKAIHIASYGGSDGESEGGGSGSRLPPGISARRDRKGSYQSIPITDLSGATIKAGSKGSDRNSRVATATSLQMHEEEEDNDDGGYGSVISL